VVIPAGQESALVVFEADAGATPTIGTVRLIGRARFGDRKDEVGYVAGVNTLGPDVSHEAVGGGIVWPLVVKPGQQARNKPAPEARLTRGFVVKVAEPSPMSLSARAASATTTPGGLVVLDVSVSRRAGFAEAVAVSLVSSLTAAPNAAPSPTVTIPKTETAGVYPLAIPKTLAPGVYTLVLQGTGPYPFSKDPNAKTKPNVTLSEPSNPITVVVRPAPATVAVNTKGGSLKAGGSLEIEVTVTPKDGSPGPFPVALAAPAGLKLSAEPIQAMPGKPVKLVVKAAADSPAGVAAGVAVRATVPVRGGPVEVNEPLAVTVTK
jgi:hypothetical protein